MAANHPVRYADRWTEVFTVSTADWSFIRTASPLSSFGKTRPARSAIRRPTYSRAKRQMGHIRHSSPIGLRARRRRLSESSVPMRMAASCSSHRSGSTITRSCMPGRKEERVALSHRSGRLLEQTAPGIAFSSEPP